MAEKRISEIEEEIAIVKGNNFNWHSNTGCLACLTELQRERNLLLHQNEVSGKYPSLQKYHVLMYLVVP